MIHSPGYFAPIVGPENFCPILGQHDVRKGLVEVAATLSAKLDATAVCKGGFGISERNILEYVGESCRFPLDFALPFLSICCLLHS